MFCAGLFLSSAGKGITGAGIMLVNLGLMWCVGWAVGVVIWGGEDGATYVGIMWGLPILVTLLYVCLYLPRMKNEQ